EARFVAKVAAKHAIAHETLVWSHGDLTGNLPDLARRARYSLLSEWARRNFLTHVLVAHTMDDVAETFLMRLGREAGLDGLAAMRAAWQADGVTWGRPLLGVRRDELRFFLESQQQDWIDDPTNDDPTYARVKARHALPHLDQLGISTESLAMSAGYLAKSREAMNAMIAHVAEPLILHPEPLTLDWPRMQALPAETKRRILNAALIYVGQSDYAPRRAALADLSERLVAGTARTELNGCWLELSHGRLAISAQSHATLRPETDFLTFLSMH
ncbi:MAG: tRNA lysidine(34) synthetase TilS, partial [Deltaproteobacteria bacterium]